jgi:carbon-monoxide dehydrogenase large subunit
MTEAVQPTPYIGRPLRRREDHKFLTGKGRYVDDIRLPGTLHLAILRSVHAHAVITGIDVSSARAAPGVRLVLPGADLSGKIGNIKPNWVIPGTVVPDRPVMAVDRVRFVGECVALVVAETREAAHDALELIGVAYKVLPAVVDEEAAIADGAPQLHDDVPNNITTYFKTGGGDYAAAVRQAVRPKGPFLRPDLSSGWRRARCRAPRVGSCRATSPSTQLLETHLRYTLQYFCPAHSPPPFGRF